MKNLLIVGLGSIGKRHLGVFLNSEAFDQIDVCDIREDRLNEGKEVNLKGDSFFSYEEAFRSKRYHAVAITCPPHLHKPVATLAVENGAHLFIEKPLCISAEGWDEIASAADQKGLVTFVAYCHRYICYSQLVKKILDSGDLGKVIVGSMRWGSYLPDWHPWEDYRDFYMAKKEQGGGALLDESHGIDLLRYWLGCPESVSAVVAKKSSLEITSDDVASLLIDFGKSKPVVQATFDLVTRKPRIEVELSCENGHVFWDRMKNYVEVSRINGDTNIHQFKQSDLMDMYSNQAEEFIRLTTVGSCEHDLNILSSIKTQRILDAAFLSAESGRKVMI